MTCDCGRSMRVKDEVAGHKIRCPDCSAVLTVPKTETDAEEEALNVLLQESPDEPKASRPRSWEEPTPRTDSLQPGPRPAPPTFPKTVVSTKPAKPKPASRSKKEPGGLFNNVEVKPYILVPGLVTMLIAVVWLVLGLLVGRIFIYPIILFFIGGGTFFKGITRGGSLD
jgi:hypothetical protein